MGDINAEGGGDASEDTAEGPRKVIDTEQGPRGEEGLGGDAIHTEEGPRGEMCTRYIRELVKEGKHTMWGLDQSKYTLESIYTQTPTNYPGKKGNLTFSNPQEKKVSNFVSIYLY